MAEAAAPAAAGSTAAPNRFTRTSWPRVGGWEGGSRAARFAGANREQNDRLVAKLRGLAEAKGITQTQLAIAWVLAKGKSIVPLIGARTRAQLAESLAALRVTLTPDDITRIEAAVPAAAVAGTRYDEHQMRMLDSERS